jgi:hypothetical protein
MPDSRDIKIEISTPFDATGSTEAAAALDSVKQKAEALATPASATDTAFLRELDDIIAKAAAAREQVTLLNEAAARNAPLTELEALKGELAAIEAEANSLNNQLDNLNERGLDPEKFGPAIGNRLERGENEAAGIQLQIQEIETSQKLAAAKTQEAVQRKAAAAAIVAAEKDQVRQNRELAASEAQVSTAADVRTISGRQRAEAVTRIVAALRPAIAELDKVSDALAKSDPAAAGNLRALTGAATALGGAAQGAAIGFQSFGVGGAIAGGLLGAAFPSLKKNLDDLVGSLNAVGDAQAVSDGLPAKIEAIKAALKTTAEEAGWKRLAEAIELSTVKAQASAVVAKSLRDLALVEAEAALKLAEASGDPARIAAAKNAQKATVEKVQDEAKNEELAASQARLAEANQKLTAEQDKLAVNAQASIDLEIEKRRSAEKLRVAQEKLAAATEKEALSTVGLNPLVGGGFSQGNPTDIAALKSAKEEEARASAQNAAKIKEATEAEAALTAKKKLLEKAIDEQTQNLLKTQEAEKAAANKVRNDQSGLDRGREAETQAATGTELKGKLDAASAQASKDISDALATAVGKLGKAADSPQVKAQIAAIEALAKSGTSGDLTQATAGLQNLSKSFQTGAASQREFATQVGATLSADIDSRNRALTEFQKFSRSQGATNQETLSALNGLTSLAEVSARNINDINRRVAAIQAQNSK